MTTLTDLARTDLGIYTVAAVFLGIAIGMAFLAICLAWDHQQEPSGVTRATSSNRKAGRAGGAR